MVDELHSKLRKVESSGEEGRTSNVAPTSPITSSNSSKFYKNLKKIKRNHGTENPTKNYYLAFPALSGNKKATTTITSDGSNKLPSPDVVGETNKDSNLQLLCWSNLMSSAKEISHPTSSKVHDDDKLTLVKMRRRRRRYGRTTMRSPKTDVQCNAKSYDVYDGVTLSPKAKNGSKKHQRNQYGKIFI